MNATNANARSFFSPLRAPSFFTFSCNPASLSLLVAWASLSFSPPLGHPPATANLIAIVAHHLVADCWAVPHITPWSPARPSPFTMPSPPAIAAPSTAAWWECPIPNTHQIRRTANAALEASTPSRRHRERGRGSGGRARSRSPPGLESSRKRRRSRSPKYEQGSPSERREKRSRDGVQRPRCYNSFFRPTTRRYVGLLSSLYPPSSQRASVLLRSHLPDAIPSDCLPSCTICIWRYDMISHVRYTSTSHLYDY